MACVRFLNLDFKVPRVEIIVNLSAWPLLMASGWGCVRGHLIAMVRTANRDYFVVSEGGCFRILNPCIKRELVSFQPPASLSAVGLLMEPKVILLTHSEGWKLVILLHNKIFNASWLYFGIIFIDYFKFFLQKGFWDTAKRKLERLQFWTSSLFVKIWSACSCEYKAHFWTFWTLYHLFFDLETIGVN